MNRHYGDHDSITASDERTLRDLLHEHRAAGLSKRERFAAMALQGILAGNPEVDPETVPYVDMPTVLADEAVAHADALIEALDRSVE